MRNPTPDEARNLRALHDDAQIASAEHDLLVIDLREKYGVAGQNAQLPMGKLEDDERAIIVKAEALGQRLGTQTRLFEIKLRRDCNVPSEAQLVNGQWHDPTTRKTYPGS